MKIIFTSGGSQLLTQIAVLKAKNYKLKDFHLIYIGIYNTNLNAFFNEVSRFYNFLSYTHLEFNINPFEVNIKQVVKNILRNKRLFDFSSIEKKFPQLVYFKNANTTIIPIRVKVFSDVLLMSYLNPKKTIFTIDGYVDLLPERKFKFSRYLYLNSELKDIPINNFVYSPDYLRNEAKKVGKYKEIKINDTISNFIKLDLVKDFEKLYLNRKIAYLFFSQHFSLTENVNIENEILFIENVVRSLNLHKEDVFLYKPHPRDTEEKIKLLNEKKIKNIRIIDSVYQALPIELFYDYFVINKTKLITCNSSAPLIFKADLEINIYKSEKYFNPNLNNKISDFSSQYNFKLFNI